MPSVQRRNDQSTDIQGADVISNGYQFMHEPIGDYGIWNGQFQLSGDPFPEGWELLTTGTVARDTGGWAGNYCLKGGNAGMGTGGYAHTLRYFPVNDTERDYYISCVAKGSTANTLYNMGAICYDAAKAVTAIIWTLAAPETAPGVAWVRRQRKIGPNGDVAWPANTRYCRPIWGLQTDQALTGEYIWIDDCQFHQLEMTYSPQIRLMDGIVSETGSTTYKDAAYTLYPATAITLTLEEPGYLWFSYMLSTYCDAAAAYASSIRAYIDGAQQLQQVRVCSPAASYWIPVAITGRSTAAYAIGNHTIDLRVYRVAGTTITCFAMEGVAWYTREN